MPNAHFAHGVASGDPRRQNGGADLVYWTIPGNHGHPATQPIPFFLGGGASQVRRGVARSAKAHTMDVTPTLGTYFGIKAPRTGWEGTSRL